MENLMSDLSFVFLVCFLLFPQLLIIYMLRIIAKNIHKRLGCLDQSNTLIHEKLDSVLTLPFLRAQLHSNFDED